MVTNSPWMTDVLVSLEHEEGINQSINQSVDNIAGCFCWGQDTSVARMASATRSWSASWRYSSRSCAVIRILFHTYHINKRHVKKIYNYASVNNPSSLLIPPPSPVAGNNWYNVIWCLLNELPAHCQAWEWNYSKTRHLVLNSRRLDSVDFLYPKAIYLNSVIMKL